MRYSLCWLLIPLLIEVSSIRQIPLLNLLLINYAGSLKKKIVCGEESAYLPPACSGDSKQSEGKPSEKALYLSWYLTRQTCYPKVRVTVGVFHVVTNGLFLLNKKGTSFRNLKRERFGNKINTRLTSKAKQHCAIDHWFKFFDYNKCCKSKILPMKGLGPAHWCGEVSNLR